MTNASLVEQCEALTVNSECISRTNPLSSYEGLLEELLIEIFSYLLHDQDRESSKGDDLEQYQHPLVDRRWLMIMLVCRRWRDICRDTPTLWRNVDIGSSSDWTRLALTRSSSCAIDVSMTPNRCSHTDALSSLIPHAHRLRFLQVAHIKEDQVDALLELFAAVLPALEDIKFYPRWERHVRRSPSSINLALSGHRHPRVRHLCISAMSAPRDPLIYANLRALSLSDCTIADTSLDEFADLLVQSTRLQSLTLDNFLHQLPGPLLSETEPRELPELWKVALRAHSPYDTSRLLARLRLPADVHLSLALDTGHDAQQSLASTTLATMFPPNHTTTLPILRNLTTATLSISGGDYTFEASVAGAEAQSESEAKSPSSTRALLSVVLEERERDWEDALSCCLTDLAAILAGSALTAITLKCTDGSDVVTAADGALETFFRALPRLERFVTSHIDMDLSVLARADTSTGTGASTDTDTSTETGNDAKTDQILCPRLRSIEMHDCAEHEGCEKAVGRIVECLQTRAEKGYRLQELKLLFECSDSQLLPLRDRCLSPLEGVVDKATLSTL